MPGKWQGGELKNCIGWMDGWTDGQRERRLLFLELEGYRAVASLGSIPGGKCDHQSVDFLGEGWEAGGQSQGSLTPTSHLLKLSAQIWYSNRAPPCIKTPCPHTWVGIRISWGALNSIESWVPAEACYLEYCQVGPWILFVFCFILFGHATWLVGS